MNKLSEVIKFFNKQYKIQVENNRTNRKLKKYYVDSKQDMRNNIAKIFDYIGVRIIIFFVVISLTLVKYNNLFAAIIAALLCTSIFHMADIIIRNRRTQRIIHKRRKYFASQKVYKEIMSKGIAEFAQYIGTILEKSGFNMKQTEILNERNLLIFSSYKNSDIMVMCKKNNPDMSVPLKEINDFEEIFINKGCTKGIIIAMSDFTKECQNYLDQRYGKDQITLIDKEKLLKIIDDAGLFPTDQEIDEYTVDKMEKQEKKLIAYREVFLAQRKIKSYIILSLFLLIWTKYTIFQLYYFSIAMILMGLAALSAYSNIKRKAESGRKFSFDKLLGSK